MRYFPIYLNSMSLLLIFIFFLFVACEEPPVVSSQKVEKPLLEKPLKWHTRVLNDNLSISSLALAATESMLVGSFNPSEFIYIMTVQGGRAIFNDPDEYSRSRKTIKRFSYILGIALSSKNTVYFTKSQDFAPSPTSSSVIYTLKDNKATLLAGGAHGTKDDVGKDAQFQMKLHVLALSTDETKLHVADTGNDAIRVVEIATQNVTTLVLNDKAGGSVVLKSPSGIAVGVDDTVYAVTGENNIVLITASSPTAGTASTLTLEGSNADLNKPDDIKVDKAGVMYVADTGNNRIVKVRPNAEKTVGTVTELLGATAQVNGKALKAPEALEVNKAGTAVYVADTGHG